MYISCSPYMVVKNERMKFCVETDYKRNYKFVRSIYINNNNHGDAAILLDYIWKIIVRICNSGNFAQNGSILGGGWKFFLHHRVQTCSGAHPPSYSMGTRGSFPGGKASGT